MSREIKDFVKAKQKLPVFGNAKISGFDIN